MGEPHHQALASSPDGEGQGEPAQGRCHHHRQQPHQCVARPPGDFACDEPRYGLHDPCRHLPPPLPAEGVHLPQDAAHLPHPRRLCCREAERGDHCQVRQGAQAPLPLGPLPRGYAPSQALAAGAQQGHLPHCARGQQEVRPQVPRLHRAHGPRVWPLLPLPQRRGCHLVLRVEKFEEFVNSIERGDSAEVLIRKVLDLGE